MQSAMQQRAAHPVLTRCQPFASVAPASFRRTSATATSATCSHSAPKKPLRMAKRDVAPLRSSRTVGRAGRQRVAAIRAEISYVMIKPDGVQRALVGEVISRFERKGFRLTALKLAVPSKDVAEEHYGELSSKPFFPDLIEYITSGPVVCMVWEGDGVVASFRKLVGATNPLSAEPGTIRGDFARVTGRNIVHASDSPENGEREAALWFKEGLPESWEATISPWLVE